MAIVWRLPIPDQLQKSPPGTLTLLDCRGLEIAELASPAARAQFPVPLERMGSWLPRVTVELEDRRFYEHHGIDWRATVAACARDLRSGHVVSGASTITQQLVKLATGRGQHSWSRKLYEAIAAWKLERRWSKQRILAEYLNRSSLRQSPDRPGSGRSDILRQTGARSHTQRSDFSGRFAPGTDPTKSVATFGGSKTQIRSFAHTLS